MAMTVVGAATHLGISPCCAVGVCKRNARSVSGGSSASLFVNGQKLRTFCAFVSRQRWPQFLSVQAGSSSTVQGAKEERFRLGNLSPQAGSRKRNKRKGRGIAAGQGASCGFGMRGQKSRSGSGVRPGFEGGQTPLYRRLPKLKGIAGGMGAGLSKFVTVNLGDIATHYSEGEEVSLESLVERRILNPSGREGKLRLKVLGDGALDVKVAVKAGAFSAQAKEKLQALGCTLTDVPGRKKWYPAHYLKKQARATEYFAQKNTSQ